MSDNVCEIKPGERVRISGLTIEVDSFEYNCLRGELVTFKGAGFICTEAAPVFDENGSLIPFRHDERAGADGLHHQPEFFQHP